MIINPQTENEAVANSSMLEHMLITVSKIFQDHETTYWLDRGALLGAWRSGVLIPDDSDIDLRVMHQDWGEIYKLLNVRLPDDLVVTAMHHADIINRPDAQHKYPWFKNESGEFLIANEMGNDDGTHFHTATALVVHGTGTFWRDKPNLDLYCCRVNQHHDCMPDDAPTPWSTDNRSYLCLPAKRETSILMPMEYVFPLSKIKLCHTAYPAPAKTKDYLEYIYGYIGEDAVLNQKTRRWIKKS